jgi:signal transduction histidine kinase
MENVVRRYRTDEESNRIMKEVIEMVHTNFIDPHTIDLRTFKEHMKKPGDMFNGLLYQAIAESVRTELNMTPDEFYFLFGQFAAIADPTFLDSAKILTVPTILWAVSVFNRGKNNVTDVREVSTKVINIYDEKHGLSLVERLVMPTYSKELLAQFSRADVDKLLYQDFITTKGAYEGLAIAKGTTSSIELVAPDYELTDIDFASKLFNWGIHPQKLLIRIAYKIGTKKPLKESKDYIENRGLYEQDLDLRVPLYVRYVVDYARTKASREKTRRSIADGLQVKFVQNLAVLQSRQEASESLRKQAEEAEARARDAEEHAQQEKALRKEAENARDEALRARNEIAEREQRSAHNTGNLLTVITSLGEILDRELNSSEKVTARATDLSKVVTAMTIALKKQNNASLILNQANGENLAMGTKPTSVYDCITLFTRDMCTAYNYIRQNRDTDRTIEGKVTSNDKDGCYCNVNADVFIGAVVSNLFSNSIKATSGVEKAKIDVYIETQGDRVMCYFGDNGYGMSEEIRGSLLRGEELEARGQGYRLGYKSIGNYLIKVGGRISDIFVLREGEPRQATKGYDIFERFSYDHGTIVAIELPRVEAVQQEPIMASGNNLRPSMRRR